MLRSDGDRAQVRVVRAEQERGREEGRSPIRSRLTEEIPAVPGAVVSEAAGSLRGMTSLRLGPGPIPPPPARCINGSGAVAISAMSTPSTGIRMLIASARLNDVGVPAQMAAEAGV